MTQRNEAFHAKVATQLSAAIAHDIRAPLNYVVKALEGMCEATHMQPDVLKEELRQVFRTSKRIYRYSDNLANFAKVMLANVEIPLSPTSVYPLIQEQIDIFQPIAASNGTVIHNKVPVDTIISSHTGILSIAIHNLLDNAAKFTKGGTICVDAGKDNQQTTYIKVVDTGVGMSTITLERYNVSADNGDQPTFEGNDIGLGLLLIKDIIQLIDGVMTIDSAAGQGTTVTLRFAHRRTS